MTKSRSHKEFLGGYAEGVTPVPIPNTEVKPLRVDGTARVAVWESRSPPGILIIKRPSIRKSAGALLRAGLKNREALAQFWIMHGYLKDGKAEFESGMAAKIKADSYRFKTESEVYPAPVRNKLYTHLFNNDPVAAGSIGLDVSLGKARMPDGKLFLNVEVKNSGAGHKMPSGSSDLRIFWLDVAVVGSDGREFAARLAKSGDDNVVDYSISCSDADDQCILEGAAVPGGRRVYRAIFLDKNGRRASSFIDASEIVFDNRLDSGEMRTEKYSVRIAPEYSGKISITVDVNYLAAPTSFTQRLGIPDYKNVKINSVKKEFIVPSVKEKD